MKGFLVDWLDLGIRKYIFVVHMLLGGDRRLLLYLHCLYHSTVFNGVYSLWSYKDMCSAAFVLARRLRAKIVLFGIQA